MTLKTFLEAKVIQREILRLVQQENSDDTTEEQKIEIAKQIEILKEKFNNL